MDRKLLLINTLVAAKFAYAAVTPSFSQIWWGYFADSDVSGISFSGYFNMSET